MAEGIYLGRQSILGRRQDLVAFELLFRSDRANSARFTDGSHATATVIQHILNEFGLDAVLGRFKGFINLDEQTLMSDLVELLPRDRIVLEVLETVDLVPEVIERLRCLKEQGFELALDDVADMRPGMDAALAIADVVKIDLPLVGAAGLPRLARELKRWPVKLLAEKIDDPDQLGLCLDAGCELFQGYYFAKPEIISGKRLSPSEMGVLRILGLVVADAESDAIETALKQEPTLAMNLLRLTTSVGVGGRARITSIASALMVLGRRQLQRWLQLALFTSGAPVGPMPSPLMHLAATRGRFMEALAASWDSSDVADRAFMTGIMSLMETLLSIPLTEILAPLNVAEDVRTGLLEGTGRLGALLALARAVEASDPTAIDAILPQLPPLTVAEVERAHVDALRWANSIGA